MAKGWRAAVTLFLLLLLGAGATLVQAEGPPAERIRQWKRATALVLLEGKGSGTAFCIQPDGVFVTSRHVVARLSGSAVVTLVINSGEADERKVLAGLVKIDAAHDLALLRVFKSNEVEQKGASKGIEGFTALPLGSDESPVETTEVVALGYPFGMALARENSSPTVTVTIGHITSLRKVKGELQMLQMDASVHPGNSGGPLLDPDGKVIGIVAAGILNTQMNFAVPVSYLRKMATKPEVLIAPPIIRRDKVLAAYPFQVTVRPLLPEAEDAWWVQVTFRGGPTADKVIGMERIGARVFRAQVTPFGAGDDQDHVSISAKFTSGTVEGVAPDLPMHLGERSMSLSDVASVDLSPDSPGVTLRDGKFLGGKVVGLKDAEIALGRVTVRTDLTRATRIVVLEKIGRTQSVPYDVTVMRGKEVAVRLSGTLRMETLPGVLTTSLTSGLPKVGAGGPELTDDPTTVTLPDKFDDVVLGGGGRYLVLRFPKTSKLGIFDLATAKVANYVELPEPAALFAAGREKLVVLLARAKRIERWDLATGKRELEIPAPRAAVARSVTMGSDGPGPIVLQWATGNKVKDKTCFEILSLESLQPIRNSAATELSLGLVNGLHVRASPGGEAFGMWRTEVSPSGVYMAKWQNAQLRIRFAHAEAGSIMPGNEDDFLCSNGAVFDAQDRSIKPPDRNVECVRAYNGELYLRIGTSPDNPDNQAACCIARMTTRIAMSPPLPEIRPPWLIKPGNDLTLDKRLFWFPSSSLLVTLPQLNDRIVLRRFDAFAKADQAGLDYLILMSAPTTEIVAGQRYLYTVETRSNLSEVKFRLASAPEGMTVSSTGAVMWDVPSAAQPGPRHVKLIVGEGTILQKSYEWDIYVLAGK